MAREVAVLWKAVRKPMGRWYARVGVWWLVAIVAAYALSLIPGSLAAINATLYSRWFGLLQAPIGLVVLLAWLRAATVADRLAIGLYEEAAAPLPESSLRARFWLSYLQGVVPLGFVLLLLCTAKLVILLGVVPWSVLGQGWAWSEVFHGPLRSTLVQAWPMLWCVMILVLMPARRLLAWALVLAPWGTTILVGVAEALLPPPPSGDVQWYWPVLAIRVLGAVVAAFVLMAMLLAYRRGMLRLAAWLYWPILVSLLARPLLYRLCSRGLDGAATVAAHASFWVTRYFSSPPYFPDGLVEYFTRKYPMGESLLFYAGFVLQDLWPFLWLAAALFVIHAWILAPARTKPAEASTP